MSGNAPGSFLGLELTLRWIDTILKKESVIWPEVINDAESLGANPTIAVL